MISTWYDGSRTSSSDTTRSRPGSPSSPVSQTTCRPSAAADDSQVQAPDTPASTWVTTSPEPTPACTSGRSGPPAAPISSAASRACQVARVSRPGATRGLVSTTVIVPPLLMNRQPWGWACWAASAAALRLAAVWSDSTDSEPETVVSSLPSVHWPKRGAIETLMSFEASLAASRPCCSLAWSCRSLIVPPPSLMVTTAAVATSFRKSRETVSVWNFWYVASSSPTALLAATAVSAGVTEIDFSCLTCPRIALFTRSLSAAAVL